MLTVRCGFDGIPTVRFGTVFRNRKSYGAVRCGFSDVVNPTVRFGAVEYPTVWSVRFSKIVKPTVRFDAVFRCEPYGAVRFSNRSPVLGTNQL